MRIAVVSDIHGNRTAFEAVLADLKITSPDLILHGGDLADSGSSPLEIVDRIRDLGWPGVVGNTDEILFRPESLPQTNPVFAAVEEMAAFTRTALGEERLDWLRALPLRQTQETMALVHASPETLWRAPGTDASDADLESVYGSFNQSLVVYGHIHRSYIRHLNDMTVANSGSVSLSYDGDPRASYLLIEDLKPSIRRVEYDIDKEVKALATSGLPHAEWIARMLRSGTPQPVALAG